MPSRLVQRTFKYPRHRACVQTLFSWVQNSSTTRPAKKTTGWQHRLPVRHPVNHRCPMHNAHMGGMAGGGFAVVRARCSTVAGGARARKGKGYIAVPPAGGSLAEA
eukprot:1136401-Pelagomonas_calceolata.AAC.2